jgi:hypothetical protein
MKLLHQKSEIEASRASADANDAHVLVPFIPEFILSLKYREML